MEKTSVMAWSIWIYRNMVIFKKHSAQPGHKLTYLLISLRIGDMIMLFLVCLCAGTHTYVKKSSCVDYRWRQSLDSWFKVNVDASRRHWMKSTWIGYNMRDHHSKIVMARSKMIGECDILVAECLIMREEILKASRRVFSDYHPEWHVQPTVNFINGKTPAPKNIVNLVEDINFYTLSFRKIE